MGVNRPWDELKALTNALQSCQTADGIVKKEDRAEAQALERQRYQAQKMIADEATAFLKARGFTASGAKPKRRR